YRVTGGGVARPAAGHRAVARSERCKPADGPSRPHADLSLRSRIRAGAWQAARDRGAARAHGLRPRGAAAEVAAGFTRAALWTLEQAARSAATERLAVVVEAGE